MEPSSDNSTLQSTHWHVNAKKRFCISKTSHYSKQQEIYAKDISPEKGGHGAASIRFCRSISPNHQGKARWLLVLYGASQVALHKVMLSQAKMLPCSPLVLTRERHLTQIGFF